MIQVKCQSCKAEFNLKDELAGKKGKCPNCENIFEIPGGQSTSEKIEVACSCGKLYKLDKSLIGKKGKCSDCGEVFEIIEKAPQNNPTSESLLQNPEKIFSVGISASYSPGESITPSSNTDSFNKEGAYSHHIYGIKQKRIAINEKYYIKDADNRDVMFSIRRVYLFKGILSLIGGALAGLVVFVGGGGLLGMFVNDMNILAILGIVLVILGLITAILVTILIFPKRHIEFHKSESSEKGIPEFTVEQDSKWEIITKNYTLRDSRGNLMAKFKKNIFTDILRKTWHINFNGKHIIVKEDSIILGLLRRYSPIAGLIRTNFIFIDATHNPKSNEIIGYFKRKFELFDNYKLDLSNDNAFAVPRQMALCMAVLLDSGERR